MFESECEDVWMVLSVQSTYTKKKYRVFLEYSFSLRRPENPMSSFEETRLKHEDILSIKYQQCLPSGSYIWKYLWQLTFIYHPVVLNRSERIDI